MFSILMLLGPALGPGFSKNQLQRLEGRSVFGVRLRTLWYGSLALQALAAATPKLLILRMSINRACLNPRKCSMSFVGSQLAGKRVPNPSSLS